jgi:hypothetical protein
MDLYLRGEIDMTISMPGIDIAKNTCAEKVCWANS